MAVQKICERCGKAISFSGYVQALELHDADGRFACARCRREERVELSRPRGSAGAGVRLS